MEEGNENPRIIYTFIFCDNVAINNINFITYLDLIMNSLIKLDQMYNLNYLILISENNFINNQR